MQDEQGNQSDWNAGNLLLASVGGVYGRTPLPKGDASCHNGWGVDRNVFSALCARQGRRVMLLIDLISNDQNFDKVKRVVKIKGKEEKMTKTYKTSKFYTSLYGRAAYEVWKAREAEIDALRVRGKYGKKEIAKMYEDNLRQLKSAGEKPAADDAQIGALEKIRVAA